jgi:hypothetical protein
VGDEDGPHHPKEQNRIVVHNVLRGNGCVFNTNGVHEINRIDKVPVDRKFVVCHFVMLLVEGLSRQVAEELERGGK